ncbi:MAG: Holliday junction resolvase RuvX [Candidatus Shapirobacteria bacterium]
MKVLAIDPGTKNIGLAIGDNGVIETRPELKNLGQKTMQLIKEMVKNEEVKKVIVGISEGKSAQLSRKFAKELRDILKLAVVLEDETLTTYQARVLKPKRKAVDSVAAALLLKQYWFFKKKGGWDV